MEYIKLLMIIQPSTTTGLSWISQSCKRSRSWGGQKWFNTPKYSWEL